MAYKCDNCGKGVMVGKQHKHHPGVAGGRWKKRAPVTQKLFRPNLHSTRVLINGMYKRMKLCTKCLRQAREAMKQASQKPQEQITLSA
ncbi:MAG: hypothetical protein M1450_02085 [Patescibacteria group bacterium]|nr:hypothetical protein [Actinomycetota bacterium]MCL5970272.1 hypothetical protein [Patescibacteria group bacterium]